MKIQHVKYVFLLAVALAAGGCVGYNSHGYRPNYYAAPRYYAPRPHVRLMPPPPMYFRPPAYCPPPRSYGRRGGYSQRSPRRRW